MTDLGPNIDFDLHEILQRPPLTIDESALAAGLAGRHVLITGAAGSIGSSLTAMLRRWGVDDLVLVDNHEHSLYELQGAVGRQPGIAYHLADIRQTRKIARIFDHHRPEVVFHLAAYKHVPLAEENPDEAFAANVLGSLNVARAAAEAGAGTLVYSSTDKAVYPPSVYGATKRMVELLLRAFSAEAGGPRCAVVRLVNAVGAQGGVIRIFARQIAAGRPLTVTDEAMTRYWISIEEAALCVAQAACLAPEVRMIVPSVGPAVRLTAVANRLRQLLRPGAEPAVVVIGMRPGERLHETLARDDEAIVPSPHPGVDAIVDHAGHGPGMGELLAAIGQMEALAAAGDDAGLRRALFAFVGG